MDDQKIIALYWARDPQAIACSQEKYGPYCFAVARNIVEDRRDAEECLNDTWLHAWKGMPPHRPNVLQLFLAKITRRVALNRWKAGRAQKRGGGQMELVLEELAQCAGPGPSVEEEVMARALGESIAAFVRALPKREGDVFTRRYFFTEPMEAIAARYGLTVNHTAVLLSRTRKKLKEHLRKEGFLYETGGIV